MALKALVLRKKIDDKKRQMDSLLKQEEELKTRETELATAVEEMTDDATAEEREVVEKAVSDFDDAVRENIAAKDELAAEISALEAELEETEKVASSAPIPEERNDSKKERKDEIKMNIPETRARMFGQTPAERETFFARSEVKDFLSEVRACIREKRAMTNVGLTIPTVMLGILRENIENYSKLYKHINVRAVSGEGRMVIMGTIPEAVWTDCCADLNELDLSFADIEVACWKVGGFFAVCNATLEDSDIDLAAEIITALGQAIGLALDKAILFGTGSRMPLGIVTRLAQTEAPSGYPATARTWEDLHETNILSISADVTGAALFAAIVLDAGAAKGEYARGEKVWVMNETTYTKLLSEALTIDANGQIVAGVTDRMPVVGGIIEVLSFIPDDVIIGGYFDLYLLAQRAGQKFATSEHFRFLSDQTVFKGTARYDGAPVIPEAFVAIGINGETPDPTDVTFAADTANN